MVYSIFFLVLAAICNAVCDTLVHHYYISVFNKKGWPAKFWNPDLSSTEAYIIPFTKYKIDAWHLFKSGMICFLIASVVMAHENGEAILNVWWFYLIEYILFGLTWNGVFNLFYNHILIKK